MNILWIDCETGGLVPRDYDITELAGIVDIGEKQVYEFDLYMKPSISSRIHPEALKVQGKTLEQVNSHPLRQREAKEEFEHILRKFIDPGSSELFLIAGQNIGFDISFLKHWFRVMGGIDYNKWFYHHSIDLVTLSHAARISGLLPNLGSLRLGAVCRELGIINELEHNALSDIRATRACYYRIIDRMREVHQPLMIKD